MNGECHADTADQQRGEAGDGEKAGQAVDDAGHTRLDVPNAIHLKVGLGISGFQVSYESLSIDIGRQRETIVEACQRTWLDDGAGRQIILMDENPGPMLTKPPDPIGFALDDRTHREVGIPDGDSITDVDIEPRQKAAFDHGAPVGERLGERQLRRIQRHRSVERISIIDHLEADDHAPITPAIGHAVGSNHVASARVTGDQFVQRSVVERPIGALDLDITTQERCRILLQPLQDAGVDHPHGGDRGDAQGEAGQEHDGPGEPASELTLRQAPGEAEVGDHATSSERSGGSLIPSRSMSMVGAAACNRPTAMRY